MMVAKPGSNVALVAVFAALIAAFALMPPLFMVGAVPFAIQLIVVLLAPIAIGPWQGALANLLYVAVGVAGLPVFSKQTSGIGVVLGPTGGYLVGYVVAAVAAGYIASIVLAKRTVGAVAVGGLIAAALMGVVVIHACGVVGLMLNAKMDMAKAIGTTLGFMPLDVVKAVVAALIAVAIFKAFPRLLTLRW